MPENTDIISTPYRHTGHCGKWAFDVASFALATRVQALKVKGIRRLDNSKTFLMLHAPDPDGKRLEVVRRLNGGRK